MTWLLITNKKADIVLHRSQERKNMKSLFRWPITDCSQEHFDLGRRFHNLLSEFVHFVIVREGLTRKPFLRSSNCQTQGLSYLRVLHCLS